MARFDDFTQHEKRVIREAITGAQSEFYDPGHTQEDRDTLAALIREITDDDLPFTFGEPVKQYRHIDPATVAMPDILRENDGFLLSGFEIAGREAREAAEKAKEHAQGGQEEAPERREALHPTRTRTPSRGPTEATAGGRPWGASRNRPEPTPRGETGFLLIECAHCGDVHAFCAKQPITTYRCGKCGQHTPLTDMHRLRVMCECGSKYNYRTNIVTQQMDVNCFKCGCPVAVEWSERRGQYEPIGWAGTHKGGRRK